MAQTPLGFPFGFYVNDNTPQDGKYYNRLTKLPYTDVAECLAMLPEGVRIDGLTVRIGGTDYWWNGGITDDKLMPKSFGTTPPTTTGYDLFTTGEYDVVGDPSDDSTTFGLYPQQGRKADNTTFSITGSAGQFIVDHADTGLQYFYVPIILTDGTLSYVAGTQAVNADYPTTFPSNTGSILTAILATDHDATPVNRKVPTAIQDPITQEIRRGNQLFEVNDSVTNRFGLTQDTLFDAIYDLFQDTDTVNKEEGVRSGDGKRQIQFNAPPGGTGGGPTSAQTISDTSVAVTAPSGYRKMVRLNVAGDHQYSLPAPSGSGKEYILKLTQDGRAWFNRAIDGIGPGTAGDDATVQLSGIGSQIRIVDAPDTSLYETV